jgi:oligopeptide transport system permease protein
MVVVLLGASMLLFACLFVLPGDPVGNLAGSARARDPVVRQALEQRYHLDAPLPEQYVRYVGQLARGDLGESFRLRRPVRDILGEKVVNTAKLAVVAILLEAVIGVGAGVIAATSHRRFWDAFVTATTTMAYGLPIFVLALLLQETFAVRLGLLPLSGSGGGWRSYVLPAVTLAAVDAAVLTRLVRNSLLEVVGADFMRTAAAKGLSARQALLRHGLRNSLIPVVTYLGIAFGALLGGTVVVEVIFDWDGIGSALVTAVGAQDNPVVLGISTVAVGAFVVVNLVVDVLYGWLDPRVRPG